MWLLTNETPFAAASTWARDERGAEFWLVAIRACFDIGPDGRQKPSVPQTQIARAPVFADDPATTEMIEDCDLYLIKARTDVLVSGHAYTPDTRPAERTEIRLKVADIDKTVSVIGDRFIANGPVSLMLSQPALFQRMPLTWERAFGGTEAATPAWEPANPVGRGFATRHSELEGKLAPNFEYPDSPYRALGTGRPAGFGPVAHHWQPRIRYGGTYGKAWLDHRDPLLPVDFDRMYYQSAPVDQQTGAPLVGYERVQLGCFTVDGYLDFLIPRLNFDLRTRFTRRREQRHGTAIHTLRLFPDLRRFELTHLSALEVPPGHEEHMEETVVRLRTRIGTPDSVLQTGVWVAD
ncbi:DUF2169 domain-containing protein [Tabrizicola sp.]|jgi:hypothetical protein|uniref:DUF2169 family type VI secretion system accessory protein n=1 Tax=Tabrizicola sp. TaxID=2005166 RepID=UPI001A46A4C9|nr:DUF2169 domain-containing protein [Tabrizicola sp.]MBL9063799.1 DUF2169 domain-containing protein [Tabrizicola sp.]